ncbi:MAG: thiamine-phosphate kinase [Elusimicrobiota bacterium]|jgi:thiamine-monophosphate kinase|nr:thiamine-phosphate kinase [Elusimicrobiota bacterium]
MKNQTISSIGEFGIIDIVKNGVKKQKGIAADIGDDAFCFKLGKEIIAVTKDMLVEDTHFKKEWTSPFDLGRKSIEVNVSDIAAMGAFKPKYVFIGCGLPPNTSLDFVKEFIKGIKNSCRKHNIHISGGDTVRADKIAISITLIAIGNKNVVKRSGAKKGDLIGVANTVGDAGAGLALLYKYGAKRKYSKDERYLISKQNSPSARLKEANLIAPFVHSMTDVSDGLDFSIDLLINGLGADIEIDKIPLSQQLKRVVKDKNKQIEYALFGAEDFELVFTIPKSKAAIIKKLVPQISYIGAVKNKKGKSYISNGQKIKIARKGFNHF